MWFRNRQMELRFKSDSDLEHIPGSEDLDEDELVQLYYALELSKNKDTGGDSEPLYGVKTEQVKVCVLEYDSRFNLFRHPKRR